MFDINNHIGFRRIFAPNKLTLGFILPLEAYPDTAAPMMNNHVELVKLADTAGFAALWARDIPLLDPNFGDAGQLYDPFTYLSFLSAHTQNIALATGSTVLTLRHPLHVAKQANSVDQLSNGRMVLGIASGDRGVEYPAFGLSQEYDERGERFREAYHYFRQAAEHEFPQHFSARFGELDDSLNLLPKAHQSRVPVVVTGSSRQDINWIAEHSDAWLYYFIDASRLSPLLHTWKVASKAFTQDGLPKPFAQGLFLDLASNPDHPVQSIHSGMRVGRNTLIKYLKRIQDMGVNHLTFNLKLSQRPAVEVVSELAEFVLPHFPAHD